MVCNCFDNIFCCFDRLLKEGLIRLLQKKDIEKIGVSELCAESGINRATFYRHYEIPLDILREIQNDFMTEIDLPTREPKNYKKSLITLSESAAF